jgi:LysR family pca operon transcriptional activator
LIDSRVKLRHLHTFVEVARQKSIGRAAEALRVSQPAVTKTIRELEEALGVPVLERDGRGTRITRYGEIFLRHAGASLTALRQGLDSVSQELFDAGPPLRIGALPTVSTRIMPRAMTAFLAAGTGSRVKIVTGENAVLMEQLRLGELDLVVGRLAAPEKMTALSFEHLYSEQVVFVVRAGHPLTRLRHAIFESFGDYPVLMPSRGSIIRPTVEQFLIAHGIASLPTQIETVSDAFGRAFVRSSDAIWIISAGVVAADIEDGLLQALPIDTTETRGPVGLTVRADAISSTPLSILMQTVREAAADIMAPK